MPRSSAAVGCAGATFDYSQLILPMMRINEYINNKFTNNESENSFVNETVLSEYLKSIGKEKTRELYADHFTKMEEIEVQLKDKKNELEKQKNDLFKQKKEKLKHSSYFQFLGLICISLGEFVGHIYKKKQSNESKT
jgi:hypothetical protein